MRVGLQDPSSFRIGADPRAGLRRPTHHVLRTAASWAAVAHHGGSHRKEFLMNTSDDDNDERDED